jgi:hypothetical protein
VSKTPDEVLQVLSEEDILRCMDSLERIYNSRIGAKYREAVYINDAYLRHCAERYLLDIKNLEKNNGSDVADKHKRAAFIMHWIVKVHPVQVKRGAAVIEPVLLVNVYFAAHAGVMHINANLDNIPQKYVRNLIYLLHFKTAHPEVLASSMYLLECALKSGNLAQPDNVVQPAKFRDVSR